MERKGIKLFALRYILFWIITKSQVSHKIDWRFRNVRNCLVDFFCASHRHSLFFGEASNYLMITDFFKLGFLFLPRCFEEITTKDVI